MHRCLKEYIPEQFTVGDFGRFVFPEERIGIDKCIVHNGPQGRIFLQREHLSALIAECLQKNTIIRKDILNSSNFMLNLFAADAMLREAMLAVNTSPYQSAN